MRPIKFRCWDKVNKIMSTGMPFKWFITGDDEDMEFPSTNESLPLGDLKWNIDDFIFMQFTGLRDKDDEEIYESDIIQWGHLPDSYEHEIRIALVKINPDIQFDCNNISFPHVFHWGKFAYSGNKLEVIGNIYEHKHLLKTKV